MSLKNSHFASFALLSLFWLWNLLFIWGDYHFFLIDQWGHIASSVLFARGYFHLFVDQFFFGYVQNLFYPPLQDAILASLHFLTDFHLVYSYKIYLSLLLAFYLFSFWILGRVIQSPFLKAVFLALCVSLLFIDKPQLTRLQGLGLTDFLFTGLNNQILSMSFFYWMIAELKSRRRITHVSLLCSLSILSHLIIGLTAGLSLFFVFLYESGNRKKWLAAGLLALGLSCFFWLPFTWYRTQIAPSLFFQFAAWSFFFLNLFVWSLKPKAIEAALLTVSTLFLLPEMFQQLNLYFDWQIQLPNFHYSRLSVVAMMLTVLALFFCLDKVFVRYPGGAFSRNSWIKLGLLGFPIVLLFLQIRLTNVYDMSATKDENLESYNTLVELAKEIEPQEGKRIWAIHSARSVDNLMGSVMASHRPELQFLKGLFWESSPNNLFITGLIASIDGLPSVVEHATYSTLSCSLFSCLFDRGLEEAQISHLIFPDRMSDFWESRSPHSRLKSPQKKACLHQILYRGGSERYKLVKEKSFRFLDLPYSLYRVETKLPPPVDFARPVSFEELDEWGQLAFKDWMLHLAHSCVDDQDERKILVNKDDLQKIEALEWDQEASPTVAFKRSETGRYRFDISARSLFQVPISYHAGFQLRDEDGKSWPVFEAFPGMLLYGEGSLELEFRRPGLFWIAYILSIFSLFIWSALLWREFRE